MQDSIQKNKIQSEFIIENSHSDWKIAQFSQVHNTITAPFGINYFLSPRGFLSLLSFINLNYLDKMREKTLIKLLRCWIEMRWGKEREESVTWNMLRRDLINLLYHPHSPLPPPHFIHSSKEVNMYLCVCVCLFVAIPPREGVKKMKNTYLLWKKVLLLAFLD